MRVVEFVLAASFVLATSQASAQTANAGTPPQEDQLAAEFTKCGWPGPDGKTTPTPPLLKAVEVVRTPRAYEAKVVDCFLLAILKGGQAAETNVANLQAYSKSLSDALLSRLELSETTAVDAAKDREAEMLARIELLENRMINLEKAQEKRTP